MAVAGTPKPTGRRVRGYISDLVELAVGRTLQTAVVYHEDYRDDAALEAAAERIHGFATSSSEGVPGLTLRGPGVFGFDTGEVRATRELMGAASKGVGWAAAVDWLIGVMQAFASARTQGVERHGSLDPHRVLITYDGAVQVVGWGLPRLDLVDFLDDATLVPITESLRFTAPESLEGSAEDRSTDLFIVGLIATELATGKPVYSGTDATSLLAEAADGEAAKALQAHDVPEQVLSWLGPMLAPWPEDRHPDLDTPLAAARACRGNLDGSDLAAAMEAHAEIGSSVEIDLPRGWALPAAAVVESDVDPAVFEAEREARHEEARKLLEPLEVALKAVDKALARLAKPSDWSDTPDADALRAEARAHGDGARAGGRNARDVLARLEKATDAASLDELEEALDEAVAQARGGAEEGERTANAALEAREKAVADQQAAQAAKAEAQERAAALDAAQAALEGVKQRARDVLAGLPERPEVTNADHPDVGAAVLTLDEAVLAARDAVGILEDITLEPDDDRQSVIDAASHHCRVAEQAAERATQAVADITAADQAATQAAEQAAAAREQEVVAHRAALEQTGTRVREAVEQVRTAVEQARQGAQGLEDEVREPLDALEARLSVLEGRQKNWDGVVDGADQVEDPSALEDLVLTARAEADFADADLEELPSEVEAFQAALQAAVEARSAFEAERAERLERLAAARAQAEQASQVAHEVSGFSQPQDLPAEAIEAEVAALEVPATDLQGAVAACVDPGEGQDMPDAEGLAAFEAQAAMAAEAAVRAKQALDAIQARIAELREQRLQAEAARREAVEHARALHTELEGLLQVGQPPQLDGDPAIDDRLEAEHNAIVKALGSFPAMPEVDIEADPVASIGALEVAVGAARGASEQLVAARKAFDERAKVVRKLVRALAKTSTEAEGYADELASLLAKARSRVPTTDAPELASEIEALQLRVEELEGLAKEASNAAEATGAADSKEAAQKHAQAAKQALDTATRIAEDIDTRAKAVEGRLSELQAAQAEADAQVRAEAVTAAHASRPRVEELGGRLEAAMQHAADALESTPSGAARQAWQAAEPGIDEAREQLAGLEALLAAVDAAEDGDTATQALEAFTKAIDGCEALVAEAVAAAEQASGLAEQETRSNVALHEALTKATAELADQVRAIDEAVEAAQDHESLPGLADVLASLKEQRGHADAAFAAVREGIQQVNDAADDDSRARIETEVREQMQRVTASWNTVQALQVRLAQGIETALRADAEQRDALRAKAQRVGERAQTACDNVLLRVDGIAALRDESDLAEVVAQVDGLVEAAQQGLAAVVSAVGTVGEQPTADEARAALDQAGVVARELSSKLEAVEAAIQTAEQAAFDLEAAREQERAERVRARMEAIEVVRGCRDRLAGWLSDIEALRDQLLTPDPEADEELAAVRAELDRLNLFLDGVPAEIGPDGLEVARDLATSAQQGEERLQLRIASLEERLKASLAAAEALSGIRDEAMAVRERYVDLETQLNSARRGLDEASILAPIASNTSGHKEAVEQLGELSTTLAEARTSLDELGAAADPDEAQALLEVAKASLDIADSLFDFALPMVHEAVEAASAEARANAERAERVSASHDAIEAALADLPSPTFAAERAIECAVDDEQLAEVLQLELAAVDQAAQEWTAAREPLTPLEQKPEDIETLEAEAERLTSLRATFDSANLTFERAVAALDEARTAHIEAERAREEKVERIRETLEKQRKALALVHAGVEERLQAARELAAELDSPDVAQALEALESHAQLVAAVEIPELVDSTVEGAEAAQQAADDALDAARDPQLDELERALREAVELERSALADRRERGEAMFARLQELEFAFHESLEVLETVDVEARQAAESWPLEAGTALEALASAIEPYRSAELPDLEAPGEAPDVQAIASLQAQLEQLEQLVEGIRAVDGRAMLDAVQAAVEAAVVASREREEALEAAHARIEVAVQGLQERQAAAAELMFSLTDELALPELDEIGEVLQAAIEQLGALVVEDVRPDDLEQAEAAAAEAERIRMTPIPVEELAQQVRDQAARALIERQELAGRVKEADGVIASLEHRARSMAEHYAAHAEGDPRLEATVKALEDAAQRLQGLRVEIPEQADVDRWSVLVVESAMGRETAESIDVDGLIEEAEAAMKRSAEEARQAETQRAEAQEQARSLVDTALLQLTVELDVRREALEDQAEGGSATQRSRARDAIEEATTLFARLEAIQAKLVDPLPLSDAVTASFEAESHAERARELLQEADAALAAARSEAEQLTRSKGGLDVLMHRVLEMEASIGRSLADMPSPTDQGAEDIVEDLRAAAKEQRELVGEAKACADQVVQATTASVAVQERSRIEAIEQELIALASRVRESGARLRAMIEREQEATAAARAEALAAGAQRARLAVTRAEEAAADVGALLEQAAKLGLEPDADDTQDAFTAMASANELALACADDARQAAVRAEQDEVAVDEAVAFADRAQEALSEASEHLATLRWVVDAREASARAHAEKAAEERLQARDAQVPPLREALDGHRGRIAEVDELVGHELLHDEDHEGVRRKAGGVLGEARQAIEQAGDRIELFQQAKPEDVEDFHRDALAALQAVEAAVEALDPVVDELEQTIAQAEEAAFALQLEEARGRAWEACQLAAQLARDLTLARNALPPFPTPAPSQIREAADRLAEIERRLWRAGQRADEAKERAGSTDDLVVALEAADAAEKAVGSARRWEKEMDAALDQLSKLLKGPGYTDLKDKPANDRMKKLRRGKLGAAEARQVGSTPAPSMARVADGPEKDNPTERLLKRLRDGRGRGETGRERLQRLRRQRKEDASASDYPTVAELEDHIETIAAGPPEDGPTALHLDPTPAAAARNERRAELLAGMRERAGNSTDEAKTQMFSRSTGADWEDDDGDTDAKTQMFTRDAMAAQWDDDDDSDEDEGGGDVKTQMFSRAGAWEADDPDTDAKTMMFKRPVPAGEGPDEDDATDFVADWDDEAPTRAVHPAKPKRSED